MIFEDPLVRKHFESLFPKEFDAFAKAIDLPPSLSVRKNLIKSAGLNLFNNESEVPWAQGAHYLPKRPKFWADPLHHAGAYYVQEASSMFFTNAIDFSEDLLVLDLCAAPGGKSTHLLSQMTHGSLLVSNELDLKRNKVLVENITRWGYPNVVVTNNKASDFERFAGQFDVVVVDAPCSGEGMFRKDKRTVEQWTQGFVDNCVIAQQSILDSAHQLVKPGGLLIYSTCTYEMRENEGQLAASLAGQEFEPIEIPFDESWGIEKKTFQLNGIDFPCYYFYLHKVRGEGQFVCAMRKMGEGNAQHRNKKATAFSFKKKDLGEFSKYIPNDYAIIDYREKLYSIPENWTKMLSEMAHNLQLWKLGVRIGELGRKGLIPDHDFAMTHWLLASDLKFEVDYDQAIDYLKRNPLRLDVPLGHCLPSYQGLPLGWGKSVSGRVNNNFPKHLQLRNEL